MIGAFTKGLQQLSDPKTRGVLWISLAIALGLFVVLWGVVGWVLTQTAISESGWVESIVDFLGWIATLLITWLLFPAVVSAGVGFLLDRVAGRVEARHYPGLGPAREAPLGEVVFDSLKFLAVMVILNIVLLPFLFFPPVFPFVFYGVNGYLLSREYFEQVAPRRMTPDEARRLRKAHQGSLFVAGIAIAVLLTVPFVNFVAPIVATAAMVHLVEGWRHRG